MTDAGGSEPLPSDVKIDWEHEGRGLCSEVVISDRAEADRLRSELEKRINAG